MLIQPRRFNLRKTLTVSIVLLIAFYYAHWRDSRPSLWELRGETMGTTYSIKIFDRTLKKKDAETLKRDIDNLLLEINRQMSTYIEDSEISRFNRHASTEPFRVASGFASTFRLALSICQATGGAFNPLLDTLINAWGFGPDGAERQPEELEINGALALTSCDMVAVDDADNLSKRDPRATLNLNAIAKGWGVDEVARLIESRGITNLFVEIGGEVFARGISEKLRTWRVGIDRPVDGAMPGEAYDLVIKVDHRGVATSGNYRNFYEDVSGRRFAHILDPRTGRPSSTSLASVTVIATNCATADALATGLFVMGTEAGIAWLQGHEGVEAAFIDHEADGSLKTTFSKGFERFLIK